MIIKNLVKRQQRRQDLYAELAAQYEMAQKEFQFEKQLGMKQSYHWLQTRKQLICTHALSRSPLF